MIEQPQAPTRPLTTDGSEQINNAQDVEKFQKEHSSPRSSSDDVSFELLREVKQLRQDVQFLKQLLEHVQKQL